MCGIIGFSGSENGMDVLLGGLSRLEYRGYDSAGVAFFKDNQIEFYKAKGRLINLEKIIPDGVFTTCGIGHTRWATHGEPTDINSHPHLSNNGKIAVVHNGIIENYLSLKMRLIDRGYRFVSDTDTEVVAHLLDYYYKGDILTALSKVMVTVRGSFALGVLCADMPDTIIAARHDSPLVIGLSEHANFIASDMPAVLNHTREFYLIDDDEIAIVKKDSVKLYDLDQEEIKKAVFTANFSADVAQKGGYEHFMLKEIYEQPKAVKDTISPRIDGKINLEIDEQILREIKKIHIIGCGSAYHTGVVGKYIMENIARVPVECDLASEFRYRNPILEKDHLCIIISQSGETADSLAALRLAKSRGVMVLCIVNVVASSIAREADYVIYTMAGPEIAVATTKAYSTQLAVLYMLAIKLGHVRGMISEEDYLSELMGISTGVKEMLDKKEELQYLASIFYNHKDIFFLGRGTDYAVALEGSLKLKEISYIRSEAYPAGELKHGTIALITEESLVVAIATEENLIEKTISNIKEVKARGATVLLVTMDKYLPLFGDVYDHVLTIPNIASIFAPSLTVVPLQMLAYFISTLRGLDVDKPRNLAKSVTVE